MKQITIEQLDGLNIKNVYGVIYDAYFSYAWNKSKYLCIKYGFERQELTDYIASGLFTKFLEYVSRSVSTTSRFYFDCYKHVFSTVKLVLSNLNYRAYCHYEDDGRVNCDIYAMRKNKVNGNLCTVYDVLKQWENRDARTEAKKTVRFFDDDSMDYLYSDCHGAYSTPEYELERMNAKSKLHAIAEKIRKHKKYNKLLAILASSERQTKTEENFLCYFKKSIGVKCSTTELLQILEY